jgi:hypothetical protein
MSTIPDPLNTASKRGKHHAILRPWISSQTACFSVPNSYIGEKDAHLHNMKYTSYSTARDWFTQPYHNRFSCIVSQILGRLHFRRSNLCDQPHICKGMTHINLLGAKWMREGGYYSSEKSCQLVPSMAHMHASLLWNDWQILGHGSQEPVGRKYWCNHWILLIDRR